MPRLDDDGQTVTLDLHGARVAEAEALALATVREAARRGRRTLRIVHGHSTTGQAGGPLGDARTIKTAIHDALDRGDYRPHAASSLRAEGHVLVGLSPAARPVSGRLRLSDVW